MSFQTEKTVLQSSSEIYSTQDVVYWATRSLTLNKKKYSNISNSCFTEATHVQSLQSYSANPEAN